jgi:hypothetical protein
MRKRNWRALRESNPCFRRERDKHSSIAVNGRFTNAWKHRHNAYFRLSLSMAVSPRILDRDWTRLFPPRTKDKPHAAPST